MAKAKNKDMPLSARVRELQKLSPLKRAATLYYGGLPRVRRGGPTQVEQARELLDELDPENKLTTASAMEKTLKARGKKFSRSTLRRARPKNPAK
jgi:hypothetical protein